MSHAIEKRLCALFEGDPDLTDGPCIIGLDNAAIALKQNFGFAKNETVLRHAGVDGVVAHVVGVGLAAIDSDDALNFKEPLIVVTKIK